MAPIVQIWNVIKFTLWFLPVLCNGLLNRLQYEVVELLTVVRPNACALFCFNVVYHMNVYKIPDVFSVLDKTEILIYESNIFFRFFGKFWDNFSGIFNITMLFYCILSSFHLLLMCDIPLYPILLPPSSLADATVEITTRWEVKQTKSWLHWLKYCGLAASIQRYINQDQFSTKDVV